jgi:beta-lactamase superfamily II metal-dependent hydrolase
MTKPLFNPESIQFKHLPPIWGNISLKSLENSISLKKKKKPKTYKASDVMMDFYEKIGSKDEPMKLEFSRTFHPIGQGAFYYEIHFTDKKNFTIVYDCGSNSFEEEELEIEISRVFPKGLDIDILFISHFHADHINGIDALKKHCNIKNVVLPELNEEAKILVKISNLINNYTKEKLIDNPKEYFKEGGKNTAVFLVKERLVPGEEGEDSETKTSINISDMDFNYEEIITIPSGKAFTFGMEKLWYFIPYNYRQEERKEDFIKELPEDLKDLTNIKTIKDILINKEKIEKAYRKIKGDLNKNSMILFSGNDKKDNEVKSVYYSPNPGKKIQTLSFPGSCIYFGDIDLKAKGVLDDIVFKSRIRDYIKNVATIQIPHHGSKHNLNDTIIDKINNIKTAIVSFGTENTYGHPCEDLMKQIIEKKITLFRVTKELNTKVTHWKTIPLSNSSSASD